MEEKRFYLTRVRIVKEEGTPYAVGEVYCAIADREELNNTFRQPVLSNRCLEEVSHQITIIHVLVFFSETLVKSNWYY